nr:Ab2-018 [Rattus norvegicus]|eukprot:NP_001041405.1 uncharacterized protein LOC499469 [Rattus norvegicus]
MAKASLRRHLTGDLLTVSEDHTSENLTACTSSPDHTSENLTERKEAQQSAVKTASAEGFRSAFTELEQVSDGDQCLAPTDYIDYSQCLAPTDYIDYSQCLAPTDYIYYSQCLAPTDYICYSCFLDIRKSETVKYSL